MHALKHPKIQLVGINYTHSGISPMETLLQISGTWHTVCGNAHTVLLENWKHEWVLLQCYLFKFVSNNGMMMMLYIVYPYQIFYTTLYWLTEKSLPDMWLLKSTIINNPTSSLTRIHGYIYAALACAWKASHNPWSARPPWYSSQEELLIKEASPDSGIRPLDDQLNSN